MNSYSYSSKKVYIPVQDTAAKKQADEKKKPKLADFIQKRDYTGALVLLDFMQHSGETDANTLPWQGFCAFHLGEYQKAADTYSRILELNASPNPINHLYKAAALYYMGDIDAAEAEALKGPEINLQTRILFHIAHRKDDRDKLVQFHDKISADNDEDQLSLASIHYVKGHFQQAVDTYKRILLEKREYLALQVYIALCYYKLDYYEVSLEILGPYLEKYNDSAIAINLKACNHFKLVDGKAAENELKVMTDALSSSSSNLENDLVKHNLVVFRNGENALQVLPPLINSIPEAKLNLIIYHLKNHEIAEAAELVADINPTKPQEFILKGVVNTCIGEMENSREHLKLGQHLFQVVGASASECDTIAGRQCMASCFFLLKNFADVIVYLSSIQQFSVEDSNFSHNYGLALCQEGKFAEAEKVLLEVTDIAYTTQYVYLSHLARCYIMNGNARNAWELYLKMESSNQNDGFSMLELIANDCYKVGAFYYSARAFDMLEKFDNTGQSGFWEGKRGACCGVFQRVIARKEPKEHLIEIIQMLNNSQNPQIELLINIMTKWAHENGIDLE